MEHFPRLDILIYAHDGRGLGHVSRSIGIGLALRRLFPALKVLFVSGCRLSQELIGTAPLDWLKLPSYATRVMDGKSRGIAGRSLYSDAELGALRAQELQHLVRLYRPRLVLVDHTPQGKHKELVPALAESKASGTLWVLGVRGVVGEVPQAQSDLAVRLFASHYHALLWYGDSAVLGSSHCELLRRHYGVVPVECGYVVRLAELAGWDNHPVVPGESPAGTIAIPWLGEESLQFLRCLAAALQKIPESHGSWRIFIDSGADDGQRTIAEIFREVRNCRIEPPGGNYVSALLHSKTALVYGGYNSIMDILHVRLPALVIYREMADEEQLIHLQRIVDVTGDQVTMVSEARVTVAELERVMLNNLQKGKAAPYAIGTDGATCAANYLYRLLS